MGILQKKRKEEKDKTQSYHEQRFYHGMAAMVSIVVVIIVAIYLTFIYSEQIQDQFFKERSKNLLNISSKVSDMMYSMINDVWSCLDTVEYQIFERKEIEEEEIEEWMEGIHRSVCIKRKEEKRDILLFIDEKSQYYMATEDGFYSGNWHNLSLLTKEHEGEGIYSTTLPYLEENQNYVLLLRELREGEFRIKDTSLAYIAVCINTNDFKECFEVDGFENQNFFYILSKDGHRLFRYEQGDSFIDVFNVFNALVDCEIIRGSSLMELKNNLKEKKEGCSEFLYEGKKYYVSSTSLEFIDWFILMFVPTEVLASNYDSFLKTTFAFSTIIAFLVVILLVSIITIFLLSYTDRKLVKQQTEANEKLARAARIARNASQAKTEFLSNMSHDIRTPINGIMGMTELALKQENNPPKTIDCLKKIDGATKHLMSLINDILDMSRIERGKVEITNSNFNILTVMEECVSIVYGESEKKELQFVVDTKGVLHDNLFGDDLHFRQIMINILGNAVKFTPNGGKIEIRVKEHQSDSRKGWFEIQIEDTGIGMKPEFLEKIFDPFCQEDSGSRSEYTGTGLGMAITKNIVELMEGTIAVESKYHEGSCFTVTLPFMINSRVQKQEVLAGKEQGIQGLTILLVDDNELNLEVAKELLELEGAKVITAWNGKEALERFEAVKEEGIDIIIMDIMMPVMDGLTATRMIRQLDRRDAKVIPIVAMTANAFQEDIQKSLEAGMNEHISKPVESDTIVSAIVKLLKDRR